MAVYPTTTATQSQKKLCGDGDYDTGEVRLYLRQRSIKAIIYENKR